MNSFCLLHLKTAALRAWAKPGGLQALNVRNISQYQKSRKCFRYHIVKSIDTSITSQGDAQTSSFATLTGIAPKENKLEKLVVDGIDENVGARSRKVDEQLSDECARFPYSDPITLDNGLQVSSADVLKHLTPLIQEGRRAKFEGVASNRTFNVVPIVEGLYDMGNVAAVCRSAEAMGFGTLHVIKSDDDSKYKTLTTRRCSAGSEKWVQLERWDHTAECITALKARGYKVLVTHLEASEPLDHFDWTEPTAVLFGNERDGVSETAVEMADARVRIPMVGFTESYNISVASALVMYHAYSDRMRRQGFHGDLSEAQKALLLSVMYLRHKHTHQRILSDILGSKEDVEYFQGKSAYDEGEVSRNREMRELVKGKRTWRGDKWRSESNSTRQEGDGEMY